MQSFWHLESTQKIRIIVNLLVQSLLSLNLWTLFREFQCGVNVQDSFGISEEWGQLSSSCVTWANVLVSQNLPF